jgi:hypothetical protein
MSDLFAAYAALVIIRTDDYPDAHEKGGDNSIDAMRLCGTISSRLCTNAYTE